MSREGFTVVTTEQCDLFRNIDGRLIMDDFIQPAEVTELTGLSSGALAQLRYQGTGPRFYKPTPRTVLYKRSEIVEWLEASAQTVTRRSTSYA
jgi:predicted DNA-binding transcriptional regulator AlpA